MALVKARVMETTYGVIYDIINTNISDNTITVTGAWPENDINSKSDFPVIVISTPMITRLGDRAFSHGDTEARLNAIVTVFSTKAKECSQLTDEIIDMFDTQKSTIEDTNNLYLGYPAIENISQDTMIHTRTKMKVHLIRIPMNFRYKYVRA